MTGGVAAAFADFIEFYLESGSLDGTIEKIPLWYGATKRNAHEQLYLLGSHLGQAYINRIPEA